MTVYEIKDPKPVPSAESIKTRRRKIVPVLPAAAIKPIDSLALKNEWQEEKGKESQAPKEPASESVLRSARAVINLINTHLETLKRGIHIALKERGNSYFLDVHDCSDGKLCDKVAEMPIVIADLPILLKRLKQEAGFLVDKEL